MRAALRRWGAPTRGPPGWEEIDGGRGPPSGVSHVGGREARGTGAGPRRRFWPRREVLAVWELATQEMAAKH
jgi:hypothetical protein